MLQTPGVGLFLILLSHKCNSDALTARLIRPLIWIQISGQYLDFACVRDKRVLFPQQNLIVCSIVRQELRACDR